MTDIRGRVQTVLGPIDPLQLGRTLTHEHLNVKVQPEANVLFSPPPVGQEDMCHCSFRLETLGWIRQHPYSHEENRIFTGPDIQKAVLKEIRAFKKSGGGTIVENTTTGLGRDVTFMKQISKETGVNIIAGTGFYVAQAQDSSLLDMSTERLTATMKAELLEGVGETGIRCGIMGELGCSSPLHTFEKKVLQAAGQVQEELQYPVNIHPGRHAHAAKEALRVFLESGGKARKTVMSHLDRSIFDLTELAEFASLGSYCEFDLFGVEVSYYQLNPAIDMPSDARRIALIHHLVDQGFEDKIVVSHDIHTRHRLIQYGGHGYSHILMNVVPKMLSRGISETVIDKILVQNPKQWLTVE